MGRSDACNLRVTINIPWLLVFQKFLFADMQGGLKCGECFCPLFMGPCLDYGGQRRDVSSMA